MSVDALLYGTSWGGPGVVVTYSFPGAGSVWDAAAYLTPGEPSVGFAAFGALEQGAVGNALLSWSAAADISFVQVSDDTAGPGTLRFGYTGWQMDPAQLAYAYVPAETANGGDVWLNAGLRDGIYSNFAPGSLSNFVLLHEIGHALGLKHPHAASPLQPATLGLVEGTVFDTVMSYYVWPGVLLSATSIDRLPTTPMALDIDALQALYGANLTSHSGDDSYVFDGAGRYLLTIYDTGGNDTIELTGTAGGEIDLRPDAWSSIGVPVMVSGTLQVPDTVRIHHSTLIENAVGAGGDDRLIGNGADNQLLGNGGDDTLDGGAGSDTMTGAGGHDIVLGGEGDDIFAGQSGHDSLEGGNGADTLTGAGGRDTLLGGAGSDSLRGGGGNDVFDYSATAFNSGDLLAGDADTIGGIEAGDRIDITDELAALLSVGGALLGNGALPEALGANTNIAFNTATDVLLIDLNGDQSADFSIALAGVASVVYDSAQSAFSVTITPLY